jgi:hypothetical protein
MDLTVVAAICVLKLVLILLDIHLYLRFLACLTQKSTTGFSAISKFERFDMKIESLSERHLHFQYRGRATAGALSLQIVKLHQIIRSV